MYTPIQHNKRAGFTLVEMLVVIAIIGILAAILIPTLYNAVRRAKIAKIALELNQLHQAVEAYKQKFGDYPPDFTDPTTVEYHLRKAFPRHSEVQTTITALTGANITPAEALVFWLSQFKNDPRRPLTGSATEYTVLFTFDEKRRKITRTITVGNTSLILYQYAPPDGKETPYAYFDSRTYNAAKLQNTASPPAAVLYPYLTRAEATAPLKFANETTYQIISAGLDGEYGDVSTVVAGNTSTYKVFPFGENYGTDGGDKDNLANFSDGRTFEDHME